MKKLMFSSLFVLVIAICLSFTGCDNDTTNNNWGETLVCLGDSLTAGMGATTPWVEDRSQSYPAFLQAKVNIPVINAGVSGDTTTHGLYRVDNDVLSHNPQIVIILLGANDIFLSFPSIPIIITRNNFQSIINKINNGNRKIFLAKFYTEAIAREMAEYVGIFDYNYQTLVINQYNSMFNSLASQNNVTLIEDIWQGVWGVHMSDEIHPNAAGYEIMANNIFNVIQPYLQANGYLQ